VTAAEQAPGKSPVNQELLLALIRGLDEKIGLLISAQKEGVKTAMDAAEKAVAKAESAADKRFEALNELRGMAADWRTEFARQSTVDLQIKGLSDKIDVLRTAVTDGEKKLSENLARGSGRHDVWAYMMAGIVAGGVLISGLITVWQHGVR
jgi:phage-related minor tail protein